MSSDKAVAQEQSRGPNNFTMAIAVKLTGVDPYRIRKYEEGGLLTPERTEGHQRLFSEKDIEIIKQAAKLEDEGINVEGIKAILAIRRGERK
ncbi:MerR family transcriptional regulator [Dehalococcoides mccartyi CG1]|uniref:MerR family transcriptional regulator n=1 Tax=Dehalococcoides mccartyi TaxID=61435 RepID=UPI0004E073AD|nr:MerR family transcriptional regulator [Dehalococcoides mccartyi]AII57431.1 MerR family transcriptional regulator [Dehalococcoides mccartyi CG1]